MNKITGTLNCSDGQSQKAVNAHFSTKQFQHFGFAEQYLFQITRGPLQDFQQTVLQCWDFSIWR